MNNQRRKWIRTLIRELQMPSPDLDRISCDLDNLLYEECDAMDNIPESLQESDRYMVAEESCSYLEDAISALDPDDPDSAEEVVEILMQIDGI